MNSGHLDSRRKTPLEMRRRRQKRDARGVFSEAQLNEEQKEVSRPAPAREDKLIARLPDRFSSALRN
jgi:hypothetical protein